MHGSTDEPHPLSVPAKITFRRHQHVEYNELLTKDKQKIQPFMTIILQTIVIMFVKINVLALRAGFGVLGHQQLPCIWKINESAE